MDDISLIPQQINGTNAHKQINNSEQTLDELQRVQNIYLELMQSFLTGNIYRDPPAAPFGPNTFNPQLRALGLDWPSQAHTMVGVKRLANLRQLIESVIADDVPGDFIETGVWRGGACIFMRAVLYAYNITDRHVWVADSFEGLPPANELQYPADAGSSFHEYKELSVTLEQVQDNFRTYGLLDQQTIFLKGWFKDTLPVAPIKQLALIRLDGDMYESTMDALTSLYPKLSPHGYVIIDDYHAVPACKAAVKDYCSANALKPEFFEIDGVAIYWRKPIVSNLNIEPASMNLNRAVTSPDMQIARLRQAIFELNENVISRLGQSIAERDIQITNLNQMISARNTGITERDKQIVQQKAHIAERNKKIAELNEKVDAFLSSTSWRMTKPIREVKYIINAMRSSPAQKANKRSGNLSDNQSSSRTNHGPSPSKKMLDRPALVRDSDPLTLNGAVSEAAGPAERSIDKPAYPLPAKKNKLPVLFWEDDLHLKIDNVNFHLTWDAVELKEGISTVDNFLLGKSRKMVEGSLAIAQQQEISKIFEMGILKGGSVVLHDQVFRPEKIVAIDYMSEPVDALTDYVAEHNKGNVIKPYYGVNQADRQVMEEILSFEFPNRDIDLIVDDASHMYDETRDAFNISFPYLMAGGLYIIEDWAWAHWAGDLWQSKNSFFYGKTALSNLLIELFMLSASRPDFIMDICIAHSTITIRKGPGTLPTSNFNIADHYLLRGKPFGAWL